MQNPSSLNLQVPMQSKMINHEEQQVPHKVNENSPLTLNGLILSIRNLLYLCMITCIE